MTPQPWDEASSASSSDGGAGAGGSPCWRQREVALVRGEVERRLAQVRGLAPGGGGGLADARGLAVELVVGTGPEGSAACRATSTLHDAAGAMPGPRAPSGPLEESYLFWGEDSRPIYLRLTAAGHWLGSAWPRCRLRQLRVDILESQSRGRLPAFQEEQGEERPLTPKGNIPFPDYDRCRDLFVLTKLQQYILKKFVRSSRHTASVRSRSERRRKTPPIEDLLDAAAEVLMELCTVVVCHLNGSYPDSEGAAGKQSKMLRMITWNPQKVPGQSPRRFRPFSLRGAHSGSIMQRGSGSEHTSDTLPSTLDPTPWDGPTSAKDSQQLWHAVRKQSLSEVQEELLKIGQQSQGEDPSWTSRVLEHRRRFRYPGNPKPLTGTVLLLALQELDEAVMRADMFDDTAIKIFKELVSSGADLEAMYKVEECGKARAVLTAPLCFAARSAQTLQVLKDFSVSFGVRSRINYYSHATILWQATWMRNADMVRFLLNEERYDNLRSGKHLYELTRKKGCEPEPARVLQWESAEDAKHKIETAETSSTPHKATSVLYCERNGDCDVWNIAYSDSHRSVTTLICQSEDKHNGLPVRFRDFCVAYNWQIRGQRHHRRCSPNTCCKTHKRIPDEIFERPPLTGWIEHGGGSDSRNAYEVKSTNLFKGWHPDFPPPASGKDRQCSALGLAVYHDMDCVPELLNYGFEIDLDELNAAIKSGSARNFLTLFGTAAKTSPDILLKLPQHTIEQCHPTLLERMWAELQDDPEVKGKLQKTVRKVMECPHEIKQEAKNMVLNFVRHAPQAAAILLDSFFLQIPKATSANRNPIPVHAWIHAKTGMNTAYVADSTWNFDSETLQPPSWQSDLIRDQVKRDATRWPSSRSSLGRSHRSSYQIQMCDIKVVNFRGILSLDLFRSLCDLRYQQQVDLLDSCVTMQAVVCHTWRKWALKYHKLLLVEEAVQFLALLAWGMSPDQDSILFSCSWTMFCFIAFGRLMQDVSMCCLNIVYMLRQWPNIAVTSLGDVLNWWDVPSHVFSVYLVSTFWTTIYTVEDGFQNTRDSDNHLFWLGVGTVLKGSAVAHRLQTTSTVGHLLIPIRDVFRDSFITAMLVVLVVVVFVFMAFVYIAWKGAAASEAKAAIVDTWVNLVIGEPVMLTGGDPDEFERPWSQYVLVSVTHLAFTIALLNVLMAITMETYRGMGLKAHSRFLRARAEVCRITLWKRRVLLTVFCNWLNLSVGRALHALFACLVVSSAVLLMTSVRLVVGLLLCGGGAEVLLTLLVLVADTPVKPSGRVQDKWWIEQHYLWVCTPREEDAAQEEAARALQQLCHGDAAEALARLARRGRAAPAPRGGAAEGRGSPPGEQPTLADVMAELGRLRSEVADLSRRQQRPEELT